MIRKANTFAEADAFDLEDVARLTFSERLAALADLRRVWFGEDRDRSRLVRVLTTTDLASRKTKKKAKHSAALEKPRIKSRPKR
jgi:hypothetical protein